MQWQQEIITIIKQGFQNATACTITTSKKLISLHKMRLIFSATCYPRTKFNSLSHNLSIQYQKPQIMNTHHPKMFTHSTYISVSCCALTQHQINLIPTTPSSLTMRTRMGEQSDRMCKKYLKILHHTLVALITYNTNTNTHTHIILKRYTWIPKHQDYTFQPWQSPNNIVIESFALWDKINQISNSQSTIFNRRANIIPSVLMNRIKH